MGSVPCIEVEVDDLAMFMFRNNSHDVIVELSLGGIEDNKDLFYFCLDLFCKGLVLMYGEDNKLIINNIQIEQFGFVKKKMENAGICVNLDIVSEAVDADADTKGSDDFPKDLPKDSLYPRVNMDSIESLPHNMPLHDYKFEIHLTPCLTYSISFEVFHKVV